MLIIKFFQPWCNGFCQDNVGVHVTLLSFWYSAFTLQNLTSSQCCWQRCLQSLWWGRASVRVELLPYFCRVNMLSTVNNLWTDKIMQIFEALHPNDFVPLGVDRPKSTLAMHVSRFQDVSYLAAINLDCERLISFIYSNDLIRWGQWNL